MKTITKNNVSLYLFEDSVAITITEENSTVGEPVQFIIGDCNSSNVVLHEGVSTPDDFMGHKYFYDGTAWSLNPDWVDPRIEEGE